DEVGPEQTVAGPGGRVDVDGHEGIAPPSEPTEATFTPALWQTQCGSGPSSGSTSSACGSPVPHTGHRGQRPYRSRRASWTSWATRPGRKATPSGHCSAHQRRCATESSTMDTTSASATSWATRSASTRARAACNACSRGPTGREPGSPWGSGSMSLLCALLTARPQRKYLSLCDQ